MQVLATLIVSCTVAFLCGLAGFLIAYAFTDEGPVLLMGLGIGGLSGLLTGALGLT